jgi:chaperonin GroEL
MDLKRGIDIAVEAVVKDIEANSKKVTSNDEIAQVGTISANGDAEIGRFITCLAAYGISRKEALRRTPRT